MQLTKVQVGKRFRLRFETLGIQKVNQSQLAVRVPEGQIVKVASGPHPEDQRMVDVLWAGKILAMFAEDVHTRGVEV